MNKSSIGKLILIACTISFFVVLLKSTPYVNQLPDSTALPIYLAMAVVLIILPGLIILGWGKNRRRLKAAWGLVGKLRAAGGWLRENVRTFGQSVLLCRVALWASVLVPYYYKYRSMPGLLKALTPGGWPFQEPTPEINKKMQLVNSYTVGILNQYESQRTRMCFRRSLVLYHFLRSRGVPARWFLGVRKLEEGEDHPAAGTLPGIRSPGENNGRYIGHAWVEINGQHYMDEMDGLRTYKINFTYPDEETYAEEVRRVYVKVKLEDLHLPHLTDLGGDGDAWFE